MAEPKKLKMGVDCPSPNDKEEAELIAVLRATIQRYLPDFARMVSEAKRNKLDVVMVHQDGFAAGYHDDEYTLLGMAIKYAGLQGLPVHIIGTNGETCKRK